MVDGAARRALNVSYVSVVWGTVTGVLSVVIGVVAASTALVGTGTDVLADVSSSVVLVWRFRTELHGRTASVDVERRAEKVASWALVVVAVGIAATAGVRLAAGEGAASSGAGMIVAGCSLAVLPVLAVVKYRIARAVPSPALRMDGNISLVGAAMAAVTLGGLAATSAFGWTRADPVAAILVAAAAGVVGIANLRKLR